MLQAYTPDAGIHTYTDPTLAYTPYTASHTLHPTPAFPLHRHTHPKGIRALYRHAAGRAGREFGGVGGGRGACLACAVSPVPVAVWGHTQPVPVIDSDEMLNPKPCGISLGPPKQSGHNSPVPVSPNFCESVNNCLSTIVLHSTLHRERLGSISRLRVAVEGLRKVYERPLQLPHLHQRLPPPRQCPTPDHAPDTDRPRPGQGPARHSDRPCPRGSDRPGTNGPSCRPHAPPSRGASDAHRLARASTRAGIDSRGHRLARAHRKTHTARASDSRREPGD